jgi:uncharacterized protein
MTTLHTVTVPVFSKLLKHANVWIDKAHAHAEQRKFDVDTLLNSRLAPDMFPLVRQFQSASDTAKGCTARLAGVDNPKFADEEKTFAEIRARLEKTIAFINSVDAKLVEAGETREIVLSPERKFATGAEYVTAHALPNFFFHITTAYAILRHNGVDVGKADYLRGGAR